MDTASRAFYDHSSGTRVFTDAVILKALREQYPGTHVVSLLAETCNLLDYAKAGNAIAEPFDDLKGQEETSLKWQRYVPRKQLDGEPAGIHTSVNYGKYLYNWQNSELVLYVVSHRDGTDFYSAVTVQYIIGPVAVTTDLILAAGHYTMTLHNEIWVYNRGIWQKDHGLWRSVQKAHWKDVILDESMKKHLIDGVQQFFNSQDQYDRVGVPWKRGIIFYGPPGNGKTISIKAIMHMLYNRSSPVPTLYVKSLTSFVPPEYSLAEIFGRARQDAPCFLVFEDLDSVVTDEVRSFFLNEIDGLERNDGILLIGSTNHLDRLDPGISKRPSRFDRKYNFPNPNFEQRVKYIYFWQLKLKDNKNIEFPNILCKPIAKITDKLSFAYIQEAFIATMLAIGIPTLTPIPNRISNDHEWEWIDRESMEGTSLESCGADDNEQLDKYPLWREIKAQVKLLRQELQPKEVS